MKRWVFPIEPAELVQILRDHSSEKEGPFSWTAKDADDRPILFLDAPKKSGKGGFRCAVKAVRYLTPDSPLAKGAVHILTLRISRARGSNAAVMLKCHKTEHYGAACLHFAEEMDKLLAELTASVLQAEPGLSGPGGSGTLVAVMNRPHDFEIARDQGWYRLPEKRAGRGAFFEYVAFYFTAAFGEEKWAVHYYARRLGHELVTRRELLPEESDHPRAGERYYKLQLGPLQKRKPPIVSLRWRRITFLHTTWDRFQAAEEVNDLFVEGGEFVDRLYHALRESGLTPERCYPMREEGVEYIADLAVPCRDGVVSVDVSESRPKISHALHFDPAKVATDPASCLAVIQAEVAQRGGLKLGPTMEQIDR